MGRILLLFALASTAASAGCQRFDARLDRYRDSRISEIERHLGVTEDSTREPSPRERAMPSLPESDGR